MYLIYAVNILVKNMMVVIRNRSRQKRVTTEQKLTLADHLLRNRHLCNLWGRDYLTDED